MYALHLCFDGNFINDSYYIFEKYYPKRNLFLINKRLDKCRLIKDKQNFTYVAFKKSSFEHIDLICKKNNVDRLVLHGISSDYIGLVKFLCAKNNIKVYWLFWGYELYISLAQMGKYRLIDEGYSPFSLISYIVPGKYNVFLRKLLGKINYQNIFKDILPYINYFCFWNHGDYRLLQDNFHTNIQYKFFAYCASQNIENKQSVRLQEKKKIILINHQASLTGNHLTLMKRIAMIDSKNEYMKVAPLSYGSNYIRKVVLKHGKTYFANMFTPILKYMSADEYFGLITQVEVAFIGARRQEASGNIINLLGSGVKVFLREDNNLLEYYRSKGFIVFSFEKDFNSLEDLSPLTPEEQLWNMNCRERNRLYYDQFMPSFFVD